MKTVAKIQNYIAEVKNHIVVLKGKLSTIKNYAVRTQSTLAEMIDILGFIIEYLKKNDRTADAEMIKMTKNEWIVLNVKNEKILVKCKNKNKEMNIRWSNVRDWHLFFVISNLLWYWCLSSLHYINSSLWSFLIIIISFHLDICSCFICHYEKLLLPACPYDVIVRQLYS